MDTGQGIVYINKGSLVLQNTHNENRIFSVIFMKYCTRLTYPSPNVKAAYCASYAFDVGKVKLELGPGATTTVHSPIQSCCLTGCEMKPLLTSVWSKIVQKFSHESDSKG